MTDYRAEGAGKGFAGRVQKGFGDLTGDTKSQVEGGLKVAQGKLLDGFGRAVDALDAQVYRAPANLQPQARQAIDFARARPGVTMLGLAAAAFLLTRGGKRH